MKTGIIFDIKEFAVYDGPGPRQTVFFKGCPLRCRWCHNPEGLRAEPELMVSIASCTHCGRCTAVCRHHPCTACGDCIGVCPLRLRRIAGTRMTSDELAGELLKSSDYYAKYGGGVTFSGGEPLLQAEFLLETLEKLPGVHCSVETSGYAGRETFERVLRRLDSVIMDLKLMDPGLHRQYTGVDNRPILENARRLCEGTTPFTIRIPVIPGVNDTEENFRSIAAWIADAKALEKVELLPYHKTAGAKYAMLGQKYEPGFDTERPIRISQKIFSEYGIRSEVL